MKRHTIAVPNYYKFELLQSRAQKVKFAKKKLIFYCYAAAQSAQGEQ